MPVDQSPLRYRAFLLRLWEERSKLPPHVTYRLSLEDAQTQQRHGFESPERLASFLQWVIAEMRQDTSDENPPHGLHHESGTGQEA